MPDRLSGELRELDRAVRTIEKAVQQTSKRQDQSIATLSAENAKVKSATPAIASLSAEDSAKITELEKRVADLSLENGSLKQASATSTDPTGAQQKILALETKNKSLQDRKNEPRPR